MISFIKGNVVSVDDKAVVLEVSGIGFSVFISMRDAQAMPDPGEEVLLHTYMNVREDEISLFGFLDTKDLSMFRLLMSASGIGPRAAMPILSVMTAAQIAAAVITDDEKQLSKAPGIGLKKAKKLIVELKDKMDGFDIAADFKESEENNDPSSPFEKEKAEAVEVLEALGYSRAEALKAVRSAHLTEDMDADEILNAALKERRR